MNTIGNVSRPTFLIVPERSRKPRTVGVTHVLDKGASVAHTEAILASAAPFIDIWKFGWGTAYLDPRPSTGSLRSCARPAYGAASVARCWKSPGSGQGRRVPRLGARRRFRLRGSFPGGRRHDRRREARLARRRPTLSLCSLRSAARIRSTSWRPASGLRRSRATWTPGLVGFSPKDGKRHGRPLPTRRERARGCRCGSDECRRCEPDPLRGTAQRPTGLAHPRLRSGREPGERRIGRSHGVGNVAARTSRRPVRPGPAMADRLKSARIAAGRSLFPDEYRGVAVTTVKGELDEDALRRYFRGREAYRRTRYVVVRNGIERRSWLSARNRTVRCSRRSSRCASSHTRPSACTWSTRTWTLPCRRPSPK